MRVRFFRPSDETETGEHLALLRRIDAFWVEIEASGLKNELERESSLPERRRIANALSSRVVSVHPSVFADVFRTPEGGRVAVLPGQQSGSGPLAEAILERAPPGLRQIFCRHRGRQAPHEVYSDVRAELGIDLTSAVVRAGFGRGHLLEVVVYSHEFAGSFDDRALEAANYALERLLGDEVFDEWVAAVDVAPAPRPSSLRVLAPVPPKNDEERFPLAELPRVVDRAVDGLRAGLPGNPYHAFCESAEWTLFELTPEARPDYAAQDDLALCVTMLPEMTKCFLEGMRFSSRRFSNHGERFVYFKIHTGSSSSEDRMNLRVELEEALNYALVPGRVGCVVGAGLGLVYVYVTLALERLETGLEIARKTGQRLDLPKRSWLQFFDSEWANEWVPVWDDAVPPPL